jgi:hypothetical protein
MVVVPGLFFALDMKTEIKAYGLFIYVAFYGICVIIHNCKSAFPKWEVK